MKQVDFTSIVRKAWEEYNPEIQIQSIIDVSVHVSTNHVYRVKLRNRKHVFAKLSYYGKFEFFKEDHAIINVLANALPPEYEHFLAQSLIKDNEVFVYRQKSDDFDVWVVFYQQVKVARKLPKMQTQEIIQHLGRELARFHKACNEVRHLLPPSSKTLEVDIYDLLDFLNTEFGKFVHRGHVDTIRYHCDVLLANLANLSYTHFRKLPVFIDWNIGNFSLNKKNQFFSRWDYDWFRVSSRVMDFYFFSRVVSTIGDRTVFSYHIDTLMEERFGLFLKAYHEIFPLTLHEVYFIKEAYRFFILNYVIKDGQYFFHEVYATRLQKEAYETYLPNIERHFNVEKLLYTLKI